MDQKWDLSKLQRKYLKVETIMEAGINHNQAQVSGVNGVKTIDLEKNRKFRIQIQPERSKNSDESIPSYSSVLNLKRSIREKWDSPTSKVFGPRDMSTSSSDVHQNETPKEFQSPLQKIGMSLIDDDDSDDSGNGREMEEPEPDAAAAASNDDDDSVPQPHCTISSSVGGTGTTTADTAAAAAAAAVGDDDEYEYAVMVITYRCNDCKTECSSEAEVQDHRMTCPPALEAMARMDS